MRTQILNKEAMFRIIAERIDTDILPGRNPGLGLRPTRRLEKSEFFQPIRTSFFNTYAETENVFLVLARGPPPRFGSVVYSLGNRV